VSGDKFFDSLRDARRNCSEQSEAPNSQRIFTQPARSKGSTAPITFQNVPTEIKSRIGRRFRFIVLPCLSVIVLLFCRLVLLHDAYKDCLKLKIIHQQSAECTEDSQII